MRRAAILLAALLVTACGSGRRPPPDSYLYAMTFQDRVPDGALLFLGDQELAVVSRSDLPGFENSPSSVSFRLPRATALAGAGAALAVRLPAPCGPSAALPATVEGLTPDQERKRREREPTATISVNARLVGPVTWPPAFTVWVDNGDRFERKIAIGRAQIRTGSVTERTLGTRLYDLGCAAQHDVVVDGAKVGTLPGDEPTASSLFFVAPGPDHCYALRRLQYGRVTRARTAAPTRCFAAARSTPCRTVRPTSSPPPRGAPRGTAGSPSWCRSRAPERARGYRNRTPWASGSSPPQLIVQVCRRM